MRILKRHSRMQLPRRIGDSPQAGRAVRMLEPADSHLPINTPSSSHRQVPAMSSGVNRKQGTSRWYIRHGGLTDGFG